MPSNSEHRPFDRDSRKLSARVLNAPELSQGTEIDILGLILLLVGLILIIS